MPTTVDIAPTVGHPVLATQLGVGGSPGYDAVDLRRGFMDLQEGVLASGDWKVTQSVTPAMTVDVAANTGRAAVQGDTIGNQGLYVVAPHATAATGLTIGANASGNPRVDQIVLQVYDATHDGSGNNKASLMVLAGTPAGGATLTNRTGAASLPNTCMRLADVLVASGAATITNAVIRDRRPWASGAKWRGVATSGNVNLTVAGAEVKTDALKARLEITGSNLVWVEFAGQVQPGNADPQVSIFPLVDGSLPDTTAPDPSQSSAIFAPNQWATTAQASTEQSPVNFAFILNPSAGSRLFSVWGQKVTGTIPLQATAATPAIFSVVELLGGSANNGTT